MSSISLAAIGAVSVDCRHLRLYYNAASEAALTHAWAALAHPSQAHGYLGCRRLPELRTWSGQGQETCRRRFLWQHTARARAVLGLASCMQVSQCSGAHRGVPVLALPQQARRLRSSWWCGAHRRRLPLNLL